LLADALDPRAEADEFFVDTLVAAM